MRLSEIIRTSWEFQLTCAALGLNVGFAVTRFMADDIGWGLLHAALVAGLLPMLCIFNRVARKRVDAIYDAGSEKAGAA